MRVEKLAVFSAVIGLAVCAGAQSLNKEIKIERDIVPEYRDADRLPISPVISLPAVTKSNLGYSLVDRPVGVTPSIFALPLNRPSFEMPEVYPGYAVIGYMPVFNTAASAGYRFINTERTRLDAWLQYNGRSYKPSDSAYNTPWSKVGEKFTEHAATVGVNLRHRTGESSVLNAAADYSYYHYNMPVLLNAKQGVSNINTSVSWKNDSGGEGLFYGIGGGFSRFAFLNQNCCTADGQSLIIMYRKPVRQNKLNFNFDAGYALSESSKMRVGFDFDYLRTPMTILEDSNTVLSTWLLRVTPGYSYSVRNLSVDMGVRIDITHGSGKAFHVAPDVKLAYKPVRMFGINLRAGGGEVQNTASSIYFDMPYMPQMFGYENSHIPFTLDAGLTFGPFKGVYLELFGGWAKANDWIMPLGDATAGISPVNVSGWHGGIKAGYNYSRKLRVQLAAEMASGADDITKSYYLWRDRAKYVIDANATYSPIEKLDISLSYILRGKRKAGVEELGSVNSANLGAKYRINDNVSVFLDGENLFNRHFRYIGGVTSQGITGLAGITLKF